MEGDLGHASDPLTPLPLVGSSVTAAGPRTAAAASLQLFRRVSAEALTLPAPLPPPPAICVCQTSAKTTKKHHKNIENQPGEEEREPMLAPAVFGGRLSAPRGGEQRQTQLCSPSEGGGAWGEMLNIW